MKHNTTIPSAIAALTALVIAVATPVHAQVPQVINYQGRISSGGTPFTGAGQFKFALVSDDGSTSFWSNDGTGAAGGEPTASVSLPVAAGLYVAPLGDTAIAGMLPLPPATFSNSGVNLRVWFNDGSNGSQQLTPDQQVLSVAYAMMAAGVPNAAITTAMIAPGSVTPDKLATDSSIPPGTVLAFAGTTAPAGYLMCDGRSYNKSDYPALAAVLNTATGAAFGGTAGANGTFNVPDLRGRFLRGADDPDGAGTQFSSAGRDPDNQPSSNNGGDGKRYANATGGNVGNLVGSVQNDAFRLHNHFGATFASVNHTHWLPIGSNSGFIFASGNNGIRTSGSVSELKVVGGGTWYTTGGPVIESRSYPAEGSATLPGDGGNETRPKNAYVNFIIKL